MTTTARSCLSVVVGTFVTVLLSRIIFEWAWYWLVAGLVAGAIAWYFLPSRELPQATAIFARGVHGLKVDGNTFHGFDSILDVSDSSDVSASRNIVRRRQRWGWRL